MNVALHAGTLRHLFEPVAIVAVADRHELQIGPLLQQAGKGSDQRVHSFISFIRLPAPDGQNHASSGIIQRQRRLRCRQRKIFKIWIECPRQHANSIAWNLLLRRDVIRGVLRRREDHRRRVAKRGAGASAAVPRFRFRARRRSISSAAPRCASLVRPAPDLDAPRRPASRAAAPNAAPSPQIVPLRARFP